MTRRLLTVVVPSLLAVLTVSPARAVPPMFQGLGQYRIVDASGRIAPRNVGGPGDRVALRPAYPPSPLLRGRPYYLTGYAGTSYAPTRGLAPTVHRSHFHGFGLFGGH